MGNIVLMFVTQGGSVSVEVDNLDNLDWVLEEMGKRGFTMFPAIAMNMGIAKEAPVQASFKNSPADPVDFCPVEGHGSSKKWKDTKEGGHYCGHKVNGSWCGYAENDAGQMRKPPKSMPDYVQF